LTAGRELSQLAAGGTTRDGWDDFKICLSGDGLRIGDNPRSGCSFCEIMNETLQFPVRDYKSFINSRSLFYAVWEYSG
jgi:hypothetical protein